MFDYKKTTQSLNAILANLAVFGLHSKLLKERQWDIFTYPLSQGLIMMSLLFISCSKADFLLSVKLGMLRCGLVVF